MSYPMLGDGNNDFHRSSLTYYDALHLKILATGEAVTTMSSDREATEAIYYGIRLITSHVPRASNPFLKPHGGRVWGEKFKIKIFRLDKNSRRRRFVPRTKGAQ